MAELTPEIVSAVVQACTSGAAEAAEALGRALGLEGIQIECGEAGTVDTKALPEGFDGPGLIVVLTVGETAALAVLPESTGLVPEWCAEPDPTGESKLTTLAQELGMILLPEDAMPEDFKAGMAKSISGALGRGAVADGAAMVPLSITSGDKKGTLSLIWPATKPGTVIGAATKKPAEAPKPAAPPKPKPSAAMPASKPAAANKPRSTKKANLKDLPNYGRSLLQVRVPVVVTLARKRQPVGRILELGPGSIIQFEKSCEEMLDLEVGDRPVATGEAVKVGDKFGLRITSMVLPEERFQSLVPAGHQGKT
ncbi:MAG: FliM/FliN family flagellar motor switch protein [Pirellulales bacterium]|nr:FliM/FliN family flagellar motor switch protein [Pirellulales bacterium]